MGTGCPPPVYVRVRRYGWRRREHAWTGGRVHRGPGAIATMMHAALVSRRRRAGLAASSQPEASVDLRRASMSDISAMRRCPAPPAAGEIEIGRPDLPQGTEKHALSVRPRLFHRPPVARA